MSSAGEDSTQIPKVTSQPPPLFIPQTVYRLQRILDPEFSFPTAENDGIRAVHLRCIHWKPLGANSGTETQIQKFDSWATRSECLRLFQGVLAGYGLYPHQALVQEAAFKMTLLRSEVMCEPCIEFGIALPGRVWIKSQTANSLSLVQSCLSRWGMIDV